MIAWITRFLLLLQVAAALLLGLLEARLWKLDNLWLAAGLGLATVVLVRMVLVANNFLLSWFYRDRLAPRPPLGWRHELRMFLSEFGASMASSSWTMAFHAFQRQLAQPAAGLPVLLIHGYGCNSGYWHSMSLALRRARISHYALDLEPVFGDIEAYVPRVAQAIDAILSETGQAQVVILAHSMGGLVARAYLRAHGRSRVAKVITLGTPHRGTGLANFGAGLNSEQMRWRGSASAWLRRLEQEEDPQARALFVSIYSRHDNIISPAASSCLEGAAANVALSGIGHVRLGMDPVVQERVVKEILAATAG